MPRDKHNISRTSISEHALKVLYRLHNNNYEAYLVGGCVRDLLLGVEPKDFDVVTNASPEQIKALFRNCRLIGRRFRLAHIVFGRDIIEVATFRGHHPEEDDDANLNTSKQNKEGLLLRDNVYGSIKEDAERRDFTINAMYYSIADFSIHDFANGVSDLEAGIVRLIGDPETRYREDPVRMLRAVRFATKLGLRIEENSRAPIKGLAHLLGNIPPARLFEEFLKLFMNGKAVANFVSLQELGLFNYFFPQIKTALKQEDSNEYRMLYQLFIDTDNRLNNGKGVTPAYLFAAILWYPVVSRAEELTQDGGLPEYDAFQIAAADVVGKQAQSISIPKRFSLPARDIWLLQLRLQQTAPRRAERLLGHPKFRAGYDFLLLRAKIEQRPDLQELADFWTEFQRGKETGHNPPGAPGQSTAPRKRRRPRRKSGPKDTGPAKDKS
ncbi:polynucleotide adenylyltransferase PcnB [Aliidiomarina minuta]|uniref:Poly(A) polymerase I n=1 Tax=Aliidiomarina minuta TaxID=880057 RepID=A0A432W545_9GAMM|nr:polynucleotide adenylyltransferase PcnB [Aliidiomarina minuta]RUO24527.1 polynucleotide adenylyltransferase PcnB [Aliidiomarina minuta]